LTSVQSPPIIPFRRAIHTDRDNLRTTIAPFVTNTTAQRSSGGVMLMGQRNARIPSAQIVRPRLRRYGA